VEYKDRINISEQKRQEVAKVFKKLKKRRPKDLDQSFHSAHDEAFSEIDCLKCANCCKTTSPIFRDVDISRIAKKLKMSVQEFEKSYLKKDDEDDWVLQSSPCHFLLEDNTCFIYDVRPQACREYPHTDRKRMVQILDLTARNMEVCPAVSQVADTVVEKYG
jgi:Fe-S-cluster containining protein